MPFIRLPRADVTPSPGLGQDDRSSRLLHGRGEGGSGTVIGLLSVGVVVGVVGLSAWFYLTRWHKPRRVSVRVKDQRRGPRTRRPICPVQPAPLSVNKNNIGQDDRMRNCGPQENVEPDLQRRRPDAGPGQPCNPFEPRPRDPGVGGIYTVHDSRTSNPNPVLDDTTGDEMPQEPQHAHFH
ncbi:hypothetical protein CDD83_9377 [Cordyceps sp. RAO-2017]|nr:hypothetical protein CDD83_9377 [Cordyceps sp. RAO-2017]